MKSRLAFVSGLVIGLLLMTMWTGASTGQPEPSLPNFDKRQQKESPSNEQRLAVERLRSMASGAKVEFDPILASPRLVTAPAFLTGPNGLGKGVASARANIFPPSDPDLPLKVFLTEHAALFGHGPEALTNSAVTRQSVAPNSGLRTVVWQQQLDGLDIFEAVLIAHTAKNGELVSVSSQFVADAGSAADKGTTNHVSALNNPPVKDVLAASTALENAHDPLKESQGAVNGSEPARGPQQARHFLSPMIKGQGSLRLVWLPIARDRLRLCWEVVFTSRSRGEMFRTLIDAQTGEVWVRHCLTAYISDATYRVYTSDSPSPLSPGLSSPGSSQPLQVPPVLVTWPALDTNASPSGWIDDGANETRGNNVDAHLDRNADDMPDLPRPQGSPFRVFDSPPDLNQDPTNYGAASVIQMFYLCNWMHDRLYQLGFTEAAGNFQNNNFGRGGVESDGLQADAQDGSGVNNANFSTPPDGSVPRMQMYIFNGPAPGRDGALDAEVVLHEYTHGLSNRRVGGGVLITALQSAGMGEGWSDFYALSLLSEAGDNINGNYAMAAYSTYLLGGLTQNYYFGIRRYPYSTDMTKNPLTFHDIDPGQAGLHSAVPRSPIIGTTANEVHNMGEVWCVTLWDARANLINKCGWTNGNWLMLQLVTDAMNLSPPNPTFLQARDAILQADVIDTGGTNQNELWAAFAKRGMGVNATCPASSTTAGIQESFDIPDALVLRPSSGFISSGAVGGPFAPNSIVLTLTNSSTNSLTWTSTNGASWLDCSLTGGTLAPGAQTNFIVSIDDSATNLAAAIYPATIWFTNLDSMVVQSRQFYLRVGQPDTYTEMFDSSTNDLAFHTFTFSPDGSVNFYSICRDGASLFPTDPTGGIFLALPDDGFAAVTLSGMNTVGLYGQKTNTFFIGSNGYITFSLGDSEWQESLSTHFSQPRISALFHDLDPSAVGTISYKQLADRVAVTYQNVPQYGSASGNNFQIEMFYDGRLRLTYLGLNCSNNLVGLSAGQGVPLAFVPSNLSGYNFCAPTAPQVTSQPTDQIVKPGGSVNFSVGAIGTAPLSFQWMKSTSILANGGRISGANSPTLTISNLDETDSGTYWVLVTNSIGSTASSNALLNVTTVDHFVWGHIPSPQSANVPFLVSLAAQNSTNGPVTNFNSTVLFSADSGAALLPLMSGNFNSGSWTGSLAIAQSGTNILLRADDRFGHVGVTSLTIVDAPALSGQIYGDIMLLSWPAGAPALKLETATNLLNPVWLPLSSPIQIGDEFVIPSSMNEPSRFYRLHYAP